MTTIAMSTVSTPATTFSTSASTAATLTGADWPSSDLDAAAAAFDALTREPDPPLSLDCHTLRPGLGLPAGSVSLAALRDWMLDHPDAHAARDAVWRHVVTRARQCGGNWLIAAAGLAMPALVGHARSLAVDYRGNPDDLDAAILTGFLTRLRRVEPRRPAVYASLVYAGWRAGLAVRRQDHRYVPVPGWPSDDRTTATSRCRTRQPSQSPVDPSPAARSCRSATPTCWWVARSN